MRTSCISAICLCAMVTGQAEAAYTLIDGAIVDASYIAELPVEAHWNAAVRANDACDWREAARQFTIVQTNFTSSPYAQEASFYIGVANYNLQEYDLANMAFTDYLQAKTHPRLFLEALEYKFCIADQFRCGARRRIMGTKRLPKWAGGIPLSIQIYDEIIAALPGHQLAVQSLYSKGVLYWCEKEYQKSVEAFQTVVRRFPKHELTPECYLLINRVFLDQCQSEFQNPDILAFAQINFRRYEQQFPRDERLEGAAAGVLAIKEVYATGLFETGAFYERVGLPSAAAIYYHNAAAQFPDTSVASLCQSRLVQLGYQIPDSEKPCDFTSETLAPQQEA